MNVEDSKRWLNWHSNLHSDFGKWYRALKGDELDDFVSATELCLKHVELCVADSISQQMFDGKKDRPYAFSMHPATVRQHGEVGYCGSFGGSSQRTIGEIEELEKEARSNPMRPIAKEFRELLHSIGCNNSEKHRPDPGGPKSGASSRIGKCPYCEGEAIIISGTGHCCKCLVRFSAGGQSLPHNEAMVAKINGKRKQKTKVNRG